MNRIAFLSSAVATSAIILLGSFVILSNRAPNFHMSGGGDYAQYSQMVESPLDSNANAPWRYRPLLPALVGRVASFGLPLPRSFLVVSSLAALASCVVFAYFIKAIGFSQATALVGTSLFAASCGGFAAIHGYGYPDALTNLFLTLTFLMVFSGKPIHAAVLITIGVMAKESLLLTLPTVLFLNRDARRPCCIPFILFLPVASYVGLRIIIPKTQGHSFFSIENITMVTDYWKTAMRHGALRWCLWSLAYSLGPIWLLAALGIRNGWRHILHTSLYILPVLIPLALTTDTNRALCLLFPVAIPVALCGFERFRQTPRIFWTVSMVAIVSVFASACTYFYSSLWKYAVFIILCLLPSSLLLIFRRYGLKNYEMTPNKSIEPYVPIRALRGLTRRSC